jgi:hypothetical protein
MKTTTFYLAPAVEKNKVPLNVRKDGKLELYDPNERVFETDPGKGDFDEFSIDRVPFVLTQSLVYLRFGGVGLYSTPRDYLTFLRHLLQIHGGLLLGIEEKDDNKNCFLLKPGRPQTQYSARKLSPVYSRRLLMNREKGLRLVLYHC